MHLYLAIVKYLGIACCVVFAAGSLVSIALIPVALRSGLSAYARSREIRDMLAAGASETWVHRALLTIRKIQNVAWISLMVILFVSLVLIFATHYTGS
jgi:hypothetical protein